MARWAWLGRRNLVAQQVDLPIKLTQPPLHPPHLIILRGLDDKHRQFGVDSGEPDVEDKPN
jgi:hypothetical protein